MKANACAVEIVTCVQISMEISFEIHSKKSFFKKLLIE